jgi:replication-associated recombination protein RarA
VSDLWVEKYRPTKLEDLIGDTDMITKFQKMIDDRSIPHLLFSGSAGIGKCVHYDTEIEVFVDDIVYEKISKYSI